MSGFDAVVRVARLALQSSAEGVETLQSYIARAASAYRIPVDVLVLPEQILLKETGSASGDSLAVVREAPGIFRLDQLAALKRVLVHIEDGLESDAACQQLDAVARSLPGLAERTSVTLVVLPALFITVPGDTLSAAAAELFGGRITAGSARLVFGFYILGLIVIGIVAAVGATGHLEYLSETVPPPQLPELAVVLAWVAFCAGLVLAFNAELNVLWWLIPSVIGTFLLQQGATVVAGSVVGTLVAGAVLGAFANLVGAHPQRPPRLILLLAGFFVLTVGGVGIRGATALFAGDIVSGLQNLGDFALQVPTVALAIAIGVIATDRWAQPTRYAKSSK